ncbi:YhcN/YlaJ family sporulation lipoprotein [Siminovitchia sediminis]|uniref:YhcN/YlaJ family sporulation lipoprotein n=1 Tax=Siminovitchia sediminis TaxID=1274353 RepID=A0ABW4KC49_9BACI
MKKAIWFCSVLLLGACGGQADEPQQEMQPSLQQTRTEMNQEDPAGVSDEDRADYLARLASNMPGVRNATAVAAGDYTVIGIDVDKDLDRSKVGSIKYAVAESIKHDPLGEGALVVADPDINARLKEIRQDMEAGRPLQGIINELADITGRLLPELPPQENHQNPQDAQQNQDNEMDKQDRQELQNEQEKESREQK